jgi:succinate dehydrogenase / fumarate reductase cytochrome b subunit
MSATPKLSIKPRPKYYDLNLLNLPLPALVSIFHRITGVVMFLFLIPVTLYLLQGTLKSESGFNFWKNVLTTFPIVKLILLGFVWAFVHHFYAGIRYLILDLHIGIDKESARKTSVAVLALGIVTTIIIGARLW